MARSHPGRSALLLGATALAAASMSKAFVDWSLPPVSRKPSAWMRYETGKVNFGLELQSGDVVPAPVLDCDEACIAAIADCLEEGCSLEALDRLDSKLAGDEELIKATAMEIENMQKTGFLAENAGTLAWLQNFLGRSGTLREQLLSMRQYLSRGEDKEDFVQQLVRAAAIGFGGGRRGDYPSVGVSPYSS